MPRPFRVLFFVLFIVVASFEQCHADESRTTRESVAIRRATDVRGVVDVGELARARADFSAVLVRARARDGARVEARVNSIDGTFVLRDVKRGTHVVDVECACALSYPPVGVDVSEASDDDDGGGGGKWRIKAWYVEDKTRTIETNPLTLKAHGVEEYFDLETRTSAIGMLKNPMVLLVAASLAMAYVGPKMLQGIDPEELKAMSEELTRRSKPGT